MDCLCAILQCMVIDPQAERAFMMHNSNQWAYPYTDAATQQDSVEGEYMCSP